MPLPAGTRLGVYEILAPIGAGGMGEVYRAKDTRLDREVAVKILPDAWANDPERLARFEREAKVLASLNHPNIAQIYGVEERALVMELVAGETLKAPLPLETALHYAKQIAEALEAAHEKGIVHRDLKPANILVTPDEVVKVLDFGLAAVPVAPTSPGDPTMTMHTTEAGMVVGTAAYMSPEQAAGKTVDKRADIWAFGVVLWRMLTGERLFTGETPSHILADVLRGPIDFEKLPKETPPAIRDLLRRCLNRDLKMRLRDIGEARVIIQEYLANPKPPLPQARSTKLPWVIAAALAIVLIVAVLFAYRPASPRPRPLIRLNAEIAPDTPLASVGVGGMLALSPDGTRFVVTLRGPDGKVRLYTRLLNQTQVTPLSGTESPGFPFFSPDGQWIGFFADGKLKKISVDGGAAVALCDAPNNRGASWGDDGNIIAALNGTGVLSRIPSAGGTPVDVTHLHSNEVTHRWPQVLPGSQAVLFTASSQSGQYEDADLDVISLKTGEQKTIASNGFSPHYLATSARTGHLIYLHGSTLFALPFDPARLTTAGSPEPILDDVSSTGTAGGDFAFSESGTFVYLPGKGPRGFSISWVDRAGKTEPMRAPPGLYLSPRFSPDGRRLAFSIGDDLWVTELDRYTPSRLSFLPGQNRWPVWTPDGRNIVFQSTSPAAPGLYWIRSDGSGDAQQLTNGKSREIPYSFSPDGKRLAFHQLGKRGTDIYTAPVEPDPTRGGSGVRLGRPELFLATPSSELYPAFSPDGRWIAYVSDESGANEVYVRPFPGPGERRQISTSGGLFPLWSRTGHELLFQTPDRHVMSVSYTAQGDAFSAGQPKLWTSTRLRDLSFYSTYDLAPEGKRLAAIVADDESGGQRGPTHLTFLLNFFDELRRRAPAGGK